VKRLLALAVGALGLTALLRRRRERTVAPAPSPADDLKATLAESRSAQEPEPELPVVDDPDVDTRRADVHARARQAMDELSSTEP
jgi:hypothetical protein